MVDIDHMTLKSGHGFSENARIFDQLYFVYKYRDYTSSAKHLFSPTHCLLTINYGSYVVRKPIKHRTLNDIITTAIYIYISFIYGGKDDLNLPFFGFMLEKGSMTNIRSFS